MLASLLLNGCESGLYPLTQDLGCRRVAAFCVCADRLDVGLVERDLQRRLPRLVALRATRLPRHGGALCNRFHGDIIRY